MKLVAQATLAVGLVGVAGCGGSGGATPNAPVSAASHSLTKNTATIFIPNATKKASASRKRTYVSPNTLSVSITATAADGYAGYVITAVPANAPNCTAVAGGRTCTLGFVAPPGTDTVQITAYDQTDAYNGAPVATVTVAGVAIASAGNNQIAFTLGGIVGQPIVLTPTSFPFAEGIPATFTLTIEGEDYDSNPISNYDAPLSITQTDTSGTYTLSATSITDSSTMPSITITYDGGSASTTITVTPTSAVTANDYPGSQATITLTPAVD